MADRESLDVNSDAGIKDAGNSLRLMLQILEGGAKVRILVASVLSGFLAVLETVAIVTVLPLVGIATGAPLDSSGIGIVWRALGEPERSTFGLILVVVVVGLFIAKDIFAIVFAWWQAVFITKNRVLMSRQIYRAIMQESFAEFRHRNVGEAMRTMNAAVGQTFNSVNALISGIAAALTVMAILIVLVITTPLQALIALVYFGIGAFAYLRFVRPKVARLGEDTMYGSKELTIAGMQGLQGFKEVKLRQTSDFFIDRFERGVRIAEYASRTGNIFSAITRYLLEILFILGVGVLLIYSFSTSTASQAVSSLALFVAAGFRLLPNISTLVGTINIFRLGRASMLLVKQEIYKLRPGSVAPSASSGEVTPFSEHLVLENVRFQYRGAHSEVLKGVDLTIPFGGSVAFVGASGAGKTTLVDIILGLLDPTEGRILVDGEDVAGSIDEWQRNCAMVPQDVLIAEDSIFKNILFDIQPEDVDEGRMHEAVQHAQLQDVVDQMEGGLDADVGDWGARLSGGQRQRIGIARALYRKPKLLVLDEATSALDNVTERKITETIESLRGDTTVIVVAHRLSTVKNVDMVVFMENGRLAGSGTFAELRQSHAGFARLVELGDLGDPTESVEPNEHTSSD